MVVKKNKEGVSGGAEFGGKNEPLDKIAVAAIPSVVVGKTEGVVSAEREESKSLSKRGSSTNDAQAVVSVSAPAPFPVIGATKGKALICYAMLIFMNCVS